MSKQRHIKFGDIKKAAEISWFSSGLDQEYERKKITVTLRHLVHFDSSQSEADCLPSSYC